MVVGSLLVRIQLLALSGNSSVGRAPVGRAGMSRVQVPLSAQALIFSSGVSKGTKPNLLKSAILKRGENKYLFGIDLMHDMPI